ncbi:Shikimate 5-dehydrogenase I alpha (EC [Olavius algarvensis associated proteobacterium Delta 3]|nr:Shikimate 5-dehydrogenase I alpha (EC [Olavius algarvensis associated proteobacterium Delta 3]CAB5155540.1 Shikimate 5-dehydrogenase I alpha (EC [Olavius algarvensis associated proteobacterium Delta 3]
MTAIDQYPQGGRPVDFEMVSLYAVIGNPVSHSLSPLMHNRAFSVVGHQGIYVAIKVTDIGAAVNGIRALGFKGVSVTIPHKISVMAHLDEIDDMAVKIGAVNTILNRDGTLVGFNSDVLGVVRALNDVTTLRGKSVAIIGAGGAARAAGFGIASEGATLTIVNRGIARGETLAADLEADFLPLAEFDGSGTDVLVNTTPVGMTPHEQETPMKRDALRASMVVMDMVYNPVKTRLLQEAERIGCLTVSGAAMFVYQGAFQFELWTTKSAPLEVMKMTVSEALGGVGADL